MKINYVLKQLSRAAFDGTIKIVGHILCVCVLRSQNAHVESAHMTKSVTTW